LVVAFGFAALALFQQIASHFIPFLKPGAKAPGVLDAFGGVIGV
jgi:hypothetical protein